jgi:hypothetical protein
LTGHKYLKGDIDKLKRIQNRAIRFVKKDYKCRETGAITRMREDLELETLEERRLSLRLILNASKEFACTTLFGRWFQ